ncbi:M12 family metallopeptidase [Legionella oakridgensis]|uniref:Astacin n=2 Tax=Legionella oakridgensis TaxID=29423 RepID=W0BFB1_9GAMM|nr:M12 family metallopeptidase [Legionella oakridgensis]AHE67129.1 astacin [Legionella oakridgensis ATCC 33761 = DSM 21215]KTD38061.1 metalloproteinase-like protein [Legionella oakridgensis]STY20216.1 astacin protease [Legionella longbeachae]
MRLSTHCNTMSIVHELGHALGLWHEQSRHDKDQYIQVVWENIKDGHAFNFTQHLTDGEDYGPYNYDSIMHYSAYAFSKNGEKTMIPLQENISIGQRNHLSQGDIDAVNGMYP